MIKLLAAQRAALGVELRSVAEASASEQRGLPGVVTVPNGQLRIVAAPAGGVVEQLMVAPGDHVKRGQVLARLASPQALEWQRDYLQASAQAQLARQSLKRDEQLFAEGLIAESRLQATRAAATQGAAQAEERRQNLVQSGAVVGKLGEALAITAPIDGVVLEQAVTVGQRLETAALIFRIGLLSSLWVDVQVSARQATGIKPGLPVRVRGGAASGRVLQVGRAVDMATQSLNVRVLIDKGSDALRPGQAVEVDLSLEAPNGGVLLPTDVLVRQGGQAVVFVVLDETPAALTMRATSVTVLENLGNRVLVSGLAPSDRIAIRGLSGLKAIWLGVGRE